MGKLAGRTDSRIVASDNTKAQALGLAPFCFYEVRELWAWSKSAFEKYALARLNAWFAEVLPC